MLYQNDFGEQVEKRFWFAFSDLILVFQFDCLVFGNEKKRFCSLLRTERLLRQSARAGQVVLHGAAFTLELFS